MVCFSTDTRICRSKSEAASLAKSALAQAQEQWRAKEKQLQTMLNLEVATRQMAEQRLQEQVCTGSLHKSVSAMSTIMLSDTIL
jgi:hypothetical protein|eukprot:COSAG01_NODE_1679_length_9512_cov_8.180708_4_plen_84_part_00